MNCFYQLFLKPYPRQGSLTSKIKHFKRDSLPLSILGWSYFPVKNTVLEYGRRWGPVDNMFCKATQLPEVRRTMVYICIL